jgi:hypothetical protein
MAAPVAFEKTVISPFPLWTACLRMKLCGNLKSLKEIINHDKWHDDMTRITPFLA